MIEFVNVTSKYSNGWTALNNVSFFIGQGEFVYIIGETGSGKSSIVKSIVGELHPQSGWIKVGKVIVNKIPNKRMPFYRRKLGVIFQDFRLLPNKRVRENLEFAAECVGKDIRQMRPVIKELLEMVGLWDKRNSFPCELSGGQQQSAAIARALVNKPKVIVADEPTGNLDPASSEKVMDILLRLNQSAGDTVVMVTHNTSLIRKYPARVIVIENGCLIKDIPKSEIGMYFKR